MSDFVSPPPPHLQVLGTSGNPGSFFWVICFRKWKAVLMTTKALQSPLMIKIHHSKASLLFCDMRDLMIGFVQSQVNTCGGVCTLNLFPWMPSFFALTAPCSWQLSCSLIEEILYHVCVSCTL